MKRLICHFLGHIELDPPDPYRRLHTAHLSRYEDAKDVVECYRVCKRCGCHYEQWFEEVE